MESKLDIKTLWAKAVDQVKNEVIQPTLWKTLELAVPITVENNQFVVGFAGKDIHLSGHLTTSVHKNAIEKALYKLSGIRLALSVIEGDSLQDWAAVKFKEARQEEFKEATRERRERESAVSKSWDSLLELIGRRYAAVPLRQLPQFRAKYIEDMLEAISGTMDVLMPEGAPPNEIAERSLARAIEKVGTLSETPAALIALELRRLRASR